MSIGVILYVLLAGYLPFDENTMVQLFQKIKNADFEYPDWFSDEARDLLSRTLVPDPAARIKLSEMKVHPWMMHADSGPEPSKGDNSAATAGAPPVSNAPVSSVPTPPPAAAAAAKSSPVKTAAAAQPPAPPAAAAAQQAKSSPAPTATPTNTPVAAAAAPAAPVAAAAAPVAAKAPAAKPDEGENVGGGGFFGCCSSNAGKHYDQV